MLQLICEIRDYVKSLLNSRSDWIRVGVGVRVIDNNAKPNFYFSHFTNLLVISRSPRFQRYYCNVYTL